MAVKTDNTGVVWVKQYGETNLKDSSGSSRTTLTNIDTANRKFTGFAALDTSGNILTWGEGQYGGNYEIYNAGYYFSGALVLLIKI